MADRRVSKLGLAGLLFLLAGATTAQAGLTDYAKELLGDQKNEESSDSKQAQADLSEVEVASGLRAALQAGAENAVAQLGQQNGFWGDPKLEIPLPPVVDKASGALRAAGYGTRLDSFQRTMNRAAEQATAEVGGIFQSVISNMSVTDAYEILRGPKNAATQYLRDNSSEQLRERIQPIVSEATSNAGVTQSYKRLTSQAGPLLAVVGSDQGDLDTYITDGALGSLFTVIAREEADIRANPAARTSDVLRAVFSRR